MRVQRYTVEADTPYAVLYEHKSAAGEYVKQEDYAALEARCSALAAENAGLKSAIEKHADSDIMCGYCLTERDGKNDDVCEVLDSTPATDAFLAEVRAQAKADGVQEYADSFRHSASKIRECHGDTIRVRALLHEASNAEEFAAQLRKGVI